MLDIEFAKLGDSEKLIYFEVASNPILQQLLKGELTTTEDQILRLEKSNEETEANFVRRFDVLQIKRNLLLSFIEINISVITEIQNLSKQ